MGALAQEEAIAHPATTPTTKVGIMTKAAFQILSQERQWLDASTGQRAMAAALLPQRASINTNILADCRHLCRERKVKGRMTLGGTQNWGLGTETIMMYRERVALLPLLPD